MSSDIAIDPFDEPSEPGASPVENYHKGLLIPGDSRVRMAPPRPRGSFSAANEETKVLLFNAKMKLVRRAEEMVEKMIAMSEDDPNAVPCPLCKRGMPRADDTKLRAIQAILDRAGLGPKTTIEIEQKNDTQWMEYLNDEEMETLAGLVEAGQSRMAVDEGAVPPIDIEASEVSDSGEAESEVLEGDSSDTEAVKSPEELETEERRRKLAEEADEFLKEFEDDSPLESVPSGDEQGDESVSASQSPDAGPVE